MTNIETRTHTITPEENGKRLDAIIGSLWPDISRTYGKKLILEGAILLDGNIVTQPKHPVAASQEVCLNLPKAEDYFLTPQEMSLDILYEDEDILVLNKPAGLVVHPAPGNRENTLVQGLLHHCKGKLSGISGVERPGIVHRLDKDTSGLMVVAKSNEAHLNLTKQFSDKSLCRTYLAFVHGLVNPPQGFIEGNIGRNSKDRKKMALVTYGGKEAKTHYTLLQYFPSMNVSLVECQLETGRTHQIRVHFAHHKHPVVGDITYGRRKKGRKIDNLLNTLNWPESRQALHAHKLKLIHPISGKQLKFICPLPEEMEELNNALE